MKNIAIIPARSGSKGLINKNIKILHGKPLLAYTVEAALKSDLFEEVMVSTDSEEYAQIARRYGAKVPFLRSRNTARDDSSSWDMVREVLEKYEEKGMHFDTFCLLQPTSPLRSVEDIRGAYDLYIRKSNVAVVSVCEAEHPPVWCGKLEKNRSLEGFISKKEVGNRQSHGEYFRLNGAIYIVNVEAFKEDAYFYRKGSFAYIMSQENSVDIDTELDFKFAEFLLTRKNS